MNIVLSTTNPTKAAYLAWLVDGLGLQCRTVEGLPPPPAESGQTLAENARLKALHYSRAANSLAIASDGRLHIPALRERWDPLLTHRFAGDSASDTERARALLTLMEGLHGNERRAFFLEAVAVADRGRLLGEWEAPGETALVAEAMSERLVSNFWAGSLLLYSRLRRFRTELAMEPGAVEAEAAAWGRLRQPVQKYLRQWLGR